MNTNLRKLVYVPVLHAREDSRPARNAVHSAAGGQTASVSSGVASRGNNVVSALARDNLPAEAALQALQAGRPQADILHQSPVDEMWAGIAAKIGELNLPWNQVRIYQDGLPVCGNELEIVTRLAKQNSWNHLLILDLLKKGAKLEGTENMDFLIREYDLLNILLMKNSTADLSTVLPTPTEVPTSQRVGTKAGALGAKVEYQAKSRELLELRDEFILNRVKTTLQEGEVGVIFTGVMHRLDKMLEKDFLISYVIYRLPFRSVGAIYNA